MNATQARTTAPPSGWIISPLIDSFLFIGAPLVCMAVFLPARAFFSSEAIAVFLLAFFTFGHHFPSFLRAYGDRELFERFKARFLLAPPILFGAAWWFRDQGLHSLLIFLAAWDIWHVLMQHYGFMRIYDAKQGSTERLTARLDWAVSLSWYVTLIFCSPHYLHDLLRMAYLTGVPAVAPEFVTWVRIGTVVFSSTLSVIYVAYHLQRWRRGLPVSFRKLIMLAIMLSATFYLYVFLGDFLVGFTVWSAFHCIQYYGIVWVYNRSRVEHKSQMTAFIRFLFRPRSALIVLYVALILAYGSINYWTAFVASTAVKQFLLAFVFTSNALHYYYDGFIWKVREKETREHLSIEAEAEAAVALSGGRPTSSGWNPISAIRNARPGLIQAAAAAAVVLFLLALELARPYDDLLANRSLVAAAPEVGAAHFRLGLSLENRGRIDEAAASYEQAVELLPGSWRTRNNLAGILLARQELDRAEALLQEAAVLLDDELGRAQLSDWSNLSASLQARDQEIDWQGGRPEDVYSNYGDVLSLRGRHSEALAQFERALHWNPKSVRALTNRASTLAEMGRFDEAVADLEAALELAPTYPYAHFNLGVLMAQFGDLRRAALHFQQAAASDDPAQREAALAALADVSRRLQP